MSSVRYSVTSLQVHVVPRGGSGAAFTDTLGIGHEWPWFCRFVYGCQIRCVYVRMLACFLNAVFTPL